VIACAALVMGVGAVASSAGAISIAPLFFDGPGGFGFSNASVAHLPVSASATPASAWLLAGGRSALTQPGLAIDNHLSLIHANPQGLGETPNAANPLIADSTWTVTNETGRILPGGYLVFTTIDADRRYPGLQAGLDGALLEILEYSSAGTDYAFGAIELPRLGVGQSVDLTVRYVVAGLLDYDPETNSYVLPRLGVAGLSVPEPTALVGIALGLGALAGARRSRSSRR
jgi:hypothetical protein